VRLYLRGRDIEMNHTDIYRAAIRRTFAELYGVPTDSVDVVWIGDSITVRCAGRTFTHQHGGAGNEFISEDEDPVTVTLSAEERAHLQRRISAESGR
jgi:hypothetical protein